MTAPPATAGPSAALGQTAYANGLHVRPISVVEDSRCPTDVTCVWAGRLVVRSEVSGGSWHRTLELELGKSQQVADGALTLVAAVPAKVAGTQTDPRAYRFTFDFQGGL
ncbi:hypothetical protein LVY65_02445 [Sphingomonas sp. G124]|uniref:Uncharacterized protein n=1 Tax=Sphingomonas cremea TaxID=2904799 RepID=A0A9X1QHR1_9SPHN|nr:hypothetical protein [Sphingomonas cremea]MCF2513928.1 hypothetical protein [Sphingomonas cremea]